MVSFFGLLREYPSLGESATYLLVGFCLVVVVLAGLSFLCNGLGFFFKKDKSNVVTSEPLSLTAAAAPAAVVSEPKTVTEGVDPRIVAVVAAAVRMALDQPYRIISIKPAQPQWAQEGRRQIFHSHQLLK